MNAETKKNSLEIRVYPRLSAPETKNCDVLNTFANSKITPKNPFSQLEFSSELSKSKKTGFWRWY